MNVINNNIASSARPQEIITLDDVRFYISNLGKYIHEHFKRYKKVMKYSGE